MAEGEGPKPPAQPERPPRATDGIGGIFTQTNWRFDGKAPTDPTAETDPAVKARFEQFVEEKPKPPAQPKEPLRPGEPSTDWRFDGKAPTDSKPDTTDVRDRWEQIKNEQATPSTKLDRVQSPTVEPLGQTGNTGGQPSKQ